MRLTRTSHYFDIYYCTGNGFMGQYGFVSHIVWMGNAGVFGEERGGRLGAVYVFCRAHCLRSMMKGDRVNYFICRSLALLMSSTTIAPARHTSSITACYVPNNDLRLHDRSCNLPLNPLHSCHELSSENYGFRHRAEIRTSPPARATSFRSHCISRLIAPAPSCSTPLRCVCRYYWITLAT